MVQHRHTLALLWRDAGSNRSIERVATTPQHFWRETTCVAEIATGIFGGLGPRTIYQLPIRARRFARVPVEFVEKLRQSPLRRDSRVPAQARRDEKAGQARFEVRQGLRLKKSD